MSNQSALSSEQALDEYFSSLLAEESSMDEADEEGLEDLAVGEEPQPLLQRMPALEPAYSPFLDDDIEELPGANLEEVQRLLSQLEGSNPVEELDLDEVLEQNTINIAQETVEPSAKEAITETFKEPSVEDEIQEWDTAMLTEDQEGEPHHHEKLESVTEPVSEAALNTERVDTVAIEDESSLTASDEPATSTVESEKNTAIVDSNTENETELDTASKQGLDSRSWTNPIRQEAFQVLYFDVNDVTFAVPLDQLGGINKLGEPSHLIGRPRWYLGLQTQRDQQLDVVDTAKWVMSEKLKDDSHQKAYQYIVMLGESMWGLACTKLMGTEWLDSERIRWREQVGKRPWLAGMVKDKMCALIHVDALIAMLNAGLDVKALDK
ncbi:chemotaxis protein CheW [Vibrio zhugei]|uniref:Chemotaxis protein CheW n=1 Tax=Vibrio zhugei TaxID=2479546 RepID=A0ABV7CED3_9VIBR|nr:chemotaxis protein CheW [Vibrio zhugei]